MSFWQMFFSVGSFLAYWINYACTKHSKGLGDWDWKVVTIFQLLAPVYIIFTIYGAPETPRWFVFFFFFFFFSFPHQMSKVKKDIRKRVYT